MADSIFNLTKLCVQGYDSCVIIGGKVSAVAKLLRNRYTKIVFFHCYSHQLNLIVNYLNKILVIRNTTGTIKNVLNFFMKR